MASSRQTFKVEGLAELDAVLRELPKATARNVLLRTLKKEAQPIADAAAQLAPDDPATGGKDLHSSMLVRAVSAKQRESDVEVAIGPSRTTFYGMFQEFGTAHHRAHPFLRPAWDANVMGVLAKIRNTLAEEIDKAVARLAKKAARDAAKMKIS